MLIFTFQQFRLLLSKMKAFMNSKSAIWVLIIAFIAMLSLSFVLQHNGMTVNNSFMSTLVLERDEAPVSVGILNMVKQRHKTQDVKVKRLNTASKYNETIPAFSYSVSEKSLCNRKNDTDVVLLVSVFVGVNGYNERQYVRSDWGAVAKSNPKLRLIYIIGQPSDSKTNLTAIKEESDKHHDIIQADFVDSYRNLTLKSFALYQWINTHCSIAKYVMKIDCDMKINLPRLLEKLEKGNVPDSFSCGLIWHDSVVVRNPKNKWYVPYDMYPQRVYPYYCCGAAFLISKRIAEKFAKISAPKYPFPVDDVYITGILRERMRENISTSLIRYYHTDKIDEVHVLG